MCGIIGIIRNDGRPAANAVLRRYEKQKSRGTDGFGYVAIADGKVVNVARSASEGEIKALLKAETAPTIIFHHRYPTSVLNVKETAHPITSDHESWAHRYHVVHNGIISNDDELKKAHEAQGIRYTTEGKRYFEISNVRYSTGTEYNDSEALAVDIALYLEGKQDALKARGSIAFIAVQEDKATGHATIYYGRDDGATLKRSGQKELIVIASEGGNEIESHTLYTLQTVGHATSEVKLTIGEQRTLCNYSYNYNRNSTGEGGAYKTEYGKTWQGGYDPYDYEKDMQHESDRLIDLTIERDTLRDELKTVPNPDSNYALELQCDLYDIEDEITKLKNKLCLNP